MGRKIIVRRPPKKVPRKARRREQRRAFRKRFKAFFDGEPDSDMEYIENGCEWMLEDTAPYSDDD